jgi:hypothetical protein
MKLIEFLFIIAVPLVVVAGALVTLFAAGVVLQAIERPQDLRGIIEQAFRRAPKAPRTPGQEHYYRPYWQESEKPRGS